jgi:broad specificity phosphatase PhoE
MSGQRVVVVRHGETVWSAELRHTGRTDVPLDEAGRAKAVSLRDVLTGHTFGLVLTSPLQRARETCRLAGFSGVAVVVDDLREWDYGAYEGLTTAQIRAQRPDWRLFRDGPEGGESLDDLAARARRVIDSIRVDGRDALLFAHGHVLRVLAATWLELPPAAAERFMLDAAALGVLGYDREWTAMLRWNARSLEGAL